MCLNSDCQISHICMQSVTETLEVSRISDILPKIMHCIAQLFIVCTLFLIYPCCVESDQTFVKHEDSALFRIQGVCVQLLTYADNVALSTINPRTPLLQQSIDISYPPGRQQQQTCSSGFAAVGPCWDRRTDKRTETVPFHRPCSA